MWDSVPNVSIGETGDALASFVAHGSFILGSASYDALCFLFWIYTYCIYTKECRIHIFGRISHSASSSFSGNVKAHFID